MPDLTTAEMSELTSVVRQMIQDCRTLAGEDGNALGCVLETIEGIPEEYQVATPRIVLFTQSGCGQCPEVEEELNELIELGVIDLISIDTDEGAKLMGKNDLMFVPTLVVLDANNDFMFELFRDGEQTTVD